MELLILSFIAGVLTVAAPCVLPLLPVIVGGSILEPNQNRWYRPLVIASSLALSVTIFTLLLKATTALLGVPQIFWNTISGAIVLFFGLTLLFPTLWEKIAQATGLQNKSNQLLSSSSAKQGLTKDIVIGAALGPVFASCSPTYALIVATVLPASLLKGTIYLLVYALGLAATLLVVAVAGQAAIKKLRWLANPNGWFKRVIGILFIVVGIAVIFGLDRDFQAYVLEQGWYDPIMKIEQGLNIE